MKKVALNWLRVGISLIIIVFKKFSLPTNRIPMIEKLISNKWKSSLNISIFNIVL